MVFSISATIVYAYSYSGYKWGVNSVSYHVNNAFSVSFRSAIIASDLSWDQSGSKFRLSYAGTTTRNPNVFSGYSYDGYNDVGHFNLGIPGTIAATFGRLSGNTILERDTTLNTYYNFSTTGDPALHDVRNIMTHEFGHWLDLLDLTYEFSPSWCGFAGESTMCAYAAPEETNKRSLETDDKDGIKAIYGI
jgi:hypothetical protein